MDTKKLSRDIVRELFDYNPDSGVVIWKHRSRMHFKRDCDWLRWNNRYSGTRAGTVKTDSAYGYQLRTLTVFKKSYEEHKIIWMWMTDDPIPEQIDHENRDATDNRWANLRASTGKHNGRNLSKQRNNTSGVTGVGWCKISKKWRARCRFDGVLIELGSFHNLDEAAMEVMEFRAEKGFDPNHGLYTAKYNEAKNGMV